jgi:hypothetical protein
MSSESIPPSNPRFGHELVSEFCFKPGYINLNHGKANSSSTLKIAIDLI